MCFLHCKKHQTSACKPMLIIKFANIIIKMPERAQKKTMHG